MRLTLRCQSSIWPNSTASTVQNHCKILGNILNYLTGISRVKRVLYR